MSDDARITIGQALVSAIDQLIESGTLPDTTRIVASDAENGTEGGTSGGVGLDRPSDRSHGDFASNLALRLAKPARQPPRVLAETLRSAIAPLIAPITVEIAGPGFLNFRLPAELRGTAIRQALSAGLNYGRSTLGAGERLQVEFVSANPTGPLHVGHGRGAAYGASLAELLAFAGYDVTREYYVNDAGRQMNILAASVWLRYLESLHDNGLAPFSFPSNGYKGDYVRDIAATLKDLHGARFQIEPSRVFTDLPADEPAGGDKEAHIDAVIERARSLLGEAPYRIVFDHGLNAVLNDIKDDLAGFGVHHDQWFSERSLSDNGAIERALAELDARGHLYTREGAVWFRSTAFGDDKDRVVRRDNGETTYFASDIAYHHEKFTRGFDRVINIWGADHHGYIPRVRAALIALGLDAERLDVQLVQFAILYRGAERVQMSTRSGSFVTLRELREEVGRDAARFFYVQRRAEQHLDFDLELAKSQSNDNPVYYIQYAHARIRSIQRSAEEQGVTLNDAALNALDAPHELALIDRVGQFPERIEHAARAREPHQIAQFLRDLAADLHSYYNAVRILDGAPEHLGARLALLESTRIVLARGLTLLGVDAPERM
ncbi:MAG: arginine--tRNA ligase [Thioalkalivibrionaceae bacterium]